MRALASPLLWFTLLCLSCTNATYTLDRDSGIPNDSETDTVDGDAGDIEEDTSPPCVPPGTEEVCNNRDDDCDGVVDNGFDKQRDPSNCGTCGTICAAPNAEMNCVEGECVMTTCLPGFEDLDPQAPGCEYQCPLFPPRTEECNGLDDDCDGEVDEPEELPTPTNICRTTPGTPCEGVGMVCDTRGTPPVTTWYCAYPPEVEFDPRVPNGIALEETLCDGVDGDCDGATDESFADLGQECDNGLVGSCRDAGERVCDPSDPSTTYCDLTLPPDADPLAPRNEQCNGLDDNCDGIVDNSDPTDPQRVVDEMIHITHSGLDFYIYTYEASRPDATAGNPGTSGVRSCSRQGVLPWANVSYQEATLACQTVGKRLCTAIEWEAACTGVSSHTYPYGDTYDGARCNGLDHDGLPGGSDDDLLLSTGSLMCLSEGGVHDLSGNLREWTNDPRGTTTSGDSVYVIRGGEYHTPQPGLTCTFDQSQAAASVTLPTIGFRCCSDTAP